MSAEALVTHLWKLETDFLAVLRDAGLVDEARRVAVQRLLERARTSAVPELSLQVLMYVLERDVDELTYEDAGFGDPVESRLSELHRIGEHVCSRCLRPLPATSTIARWRARRLASAWGRRPEREAAAGD